VKPPYPPSFLLDTPKSFGLLTMVVAAISFVVDGIAFFLFLNRKKKKEIGEGGVFCHKGSRPFLLLFDCFFFLPSLTF
jgi:hypothetical protein